MTQTNHRKLIMKKTIASISASALLILGGSFLGSAAWGASGDLAIGTVIVGGQSVTTVEAGQQFTARIVHQGVAEGDVSATDDFCGLNVGSTQTDSNLNIFIEASNGNNWSIPEDGLSEETRGLGSFTWTNEPGTSVEVSAQIPADAVLGEYLFIYQCKDTDGNPSGGGAQGFTVNIVAASNVDPVTPPDTTTVDPTLAHTGVDEASNYALLGASALLIAAGAAIYTIRKRASVKN